MGTKNGSPNPANVYGPCYAVATSNSAYIFHFNYICSPSSISWYIASV